jgi:hypothetical protein
VNSQGVQYGGSGSGASGLFQSEPVPYDGYAQSIALELPARGLLVLEHEPNAGVPQLVGVPDSISLTAGGAQTLTLTAGVELAGDLYFLLGSASGTTPGLPLAPGWILPLQLDAYLQLTLAAPNAGPFGSTLGFLDASGGAGAALSLPAGSAPAFPGGTLHHAYFSFDLVTLAVTSVSNAVPVLLLP